MSTFDLREFIDDRIGVRIIGSGGHGEELICNCPFCDGKEKFYVNPDRGKFICYKCGEKGDSVALVQEVDGLSRRLALQLVYSGVRLARPVDEIRAGLEAEPEPDLPNSASPAKPVLALPEEFVPVFDGSTWNIPRYLRDRRIQARVSAAYGVGYCASGRYGGRIILPAHVNGALAFFQARSVIGASPKYLAPVVDRSGVLWGYDEALGAAHAFVVEGPFDVLGCAQAGLIAVGLMGKVCSMRQAALLISAGFQRVTMMLDPEATREAAAAAQLLSEVIDVVDLARLPDGCDPGDASREVLLAAAENSHAPTLRDRLL